MLQQVDAIYERGLLRPLTPLALDERQCVRLIVDGVAPDGGLDSAMVEWARAEVAGIAEIPAIEEVRDLLSTISGSVSDAVIAERGEY